MNDDDRFVALLRSALPPVADDVAARDLWPAVVSRCRTPIPWSWFDLGLAAAVATVLLLFPDWLWLVIYHL